MKKRMLALLLACVMVLLAAPAVLPITAAEVNLFSETFDAATDVEYSGDTKVMPEPTDIPFLFTWFYPNGQPVPKNTTLTDDCYAEYNQVLIDDGIFSPDEKFSVILEKYRAHLEEYGNISFTGNWEMVCLRFDNNHIGETHKLTRAFMSQYGNIYGAYWKACGTTTNECWEQYWVLPQKVRDDLMKQMFESLAPIYVEPGSDGKILFAEIKALFKQSGGVNIGAYQARQSTVGSGANTFDGVLYAMPSQASSTAYVYTVPELVVGEAKISIDSITTKTYTGSGKICLLINNKTEWPANADFTKPDTWADIDPTNPNMAAELNESLKDVVLQVVPGDKIALAVHRNDSSIAVNIKPTITVDKDCVVTFEDQDGNLLSTGGGKVGQPFPKAPYAAGEGGYLIDGVAAAELPEVITGDVTVKYVGDVVVTDPAVKAVSISVSSNFALNVFLNADPYATRVGVLDEEGEEIWAEEQEDGSYKLSVPNLNAKDMDQALVLETVQEFADGRQYDGSEEIEIVPTEVLAAYADSDATAEEKAVAAAALDYAVAAKAYFYGGVLDAEVEARLAAQDAAIAEIESDVQYADKGEYCVNGVALVLRDQVAFKVRVALSEMSFIDEEALDYTVMVEHNGSEIEYDHGFEFTEGDEELTMVMTLGGISTANFGVTYKIVVKDADYAVSEVFEYSVNDYIARKFDANAKDANVLRAIYALGEAAANAVNG